MSCLFRFIYLSDIMQVTQRFDDIVRNLSLREDWPPPPLPATAALHLEEEEDLSEEDQRRKQELEDEVSHALHLST